MSLQIQLKKNKKKKQSWKKESNRMFLHWLANPPTVYYSWMSEDRMNATGDKVPELNGAGLNKNIDTHLCHSDLFLISLLLPHI